MCAQELIEKREGCIATALEILGSKWTALILRDLAAGSKGFCELEKSVNKINPRTLSQRLDDLEAHGIINKSTGSTRPTYSLTQKGEDLIPVLKQMAAWGTKYYSKV